MNCSMWDHGYCPDCDLFKSQLCKGYPVRTKDEKAVAEQILEFSRNPRLAGGPAVSEMPKIRLRLVDVEKDQSRICDLDEARTWDWANPEIMRIIGDWQVSSFDMLLFILREKEEKGEEEVSLFEAPRFMILSGG